ADAPLRVRFLARNRTMLLARRAAPELVALVLAAEGRADHLGPGPAFAGSVAVALAVAGGRARVAQPVGQVGVGRVEGQRLVVGCVGLDVPVPLHARPCGDELADDHVLLEPDQPVPAALDGGAGQDAVRALSRGSPPP